MTQHNIISYNQLTSWSHPITEEPTQMDDYFECLIECSDDQSTCRRMCADVFR